MSYPPQYPPGGQYGPHPGTGPQYAPQPGYGAAPKPPSSGGNTVAVVIISVVAAAILLLVGVVGFVLFFADSEANEDPVSNRPGATGEGPGFDVDGEWAGTLTQYDSSGDIHGFFDVSVTIEGNEVVHAEETSQDFAFDLCEWDVSGVVWTDDTLRFDYEVVPEHQDQSCANTGDAEIVFHDWGAADISSNDVSDGVLYPVE
ncbi:hypothetical protein J4H86_16555 [Spiractinospora alimapuensis]|uniref:hypothetical protein n=1 Tax=Spiractinospora alimapuensis TaxID=2820884 RepID=UPI001F23F99B|nr:hypothetical protein [Spiractinospora alimapuensis]QVQ50514.1 hypothetical protein J4H86_16555 [Spiractinospora alimapuensis]